MNSHYFAQYLLNEGAVPSGDMEELLGKAMDSEPGLAVRALWQKEAVAADFAGLEQMKDEDFEAAVQERNLLTKSQIRNLREAVIGESLRFAEILLREGRMDFAALEKEFSGYDKVAQQPVLTAVEKQISEEIEAEAAGYGEFTDVFVLSLIRFMRIPAVVMPTIFEMQPRHQYYSVSQRIYGDVNISGAMMADEQVCMELAARYSQEKISKMDAFTVDCLAEFLNVMTGLFAVKLAKRDLDVDLETPRWAENPKMNGNKQISLSIMTGIGSLELVLATDEMF